MHFRSFAILLACLVPAGPLGASPAEIVTYDSLPGRIRASNPDLAAARLRIDEALGRMNQSGRLSNPDLETSFEHDPRFREGKLEIGFFQRFPVTGRLRLEREISVTQLKAAEAEVREVERRLVSEARQALVHVLAIRQRRELLREQERLSKEFSDHLRSVAERGEGSSLDAGQAGLETAALALETRQLDAAEASAAGVLKPLLGMLPGAPLIVGGSLPAPVIPGENADPSRRPDFQSAVLEEEAAARNVELEQAKRYDDAGAGVFVAAERSEDAPQGYENEAIVGVRFTIPLPLWNRNEGNIEAAQATRKRKELEAVALGRSIRLEAETARNEMREWAGILTELGGALIPLAEEQSAAAEETFRAGQGDIQMVIRSREKRLQLAAARIDALREFHLARARYEAAVAKP